MWRANSPKGDVRTVPSLIYLRCRQRGPRWRCRKAGHHSLYVMVKYYFWAAVSLVAPVKEPCADQSLKRVRYGKKGVTSSGIFSAGESIVMCLIFCISIRLLQGSSRIRVPNDK